MKHNTIRFLLLAAALAAPTLSPRLSAQVPSYNPGGWIRTRAWSFLMPLVHDSWARADGPNHMLRNWVAPHEIALENPEPRDEWDIDFSQAASKAHPFINIIGVSHPWFSTQSLEADYSLPNHSLPEGDAVDLTALANSINTQIVDFLSPGIRAYLPVENTLGIAATYVENTSGSAWPVRLCISSDDSVQVWVNDRLVDNSSAARGLAGTCSEEPRVWLPPGISRIMVLVWQGTGGWGFRLGLIDGNQLIDEDHSSIRILGPGGSSINPPQRYKLDRSIGPDPLACPRQTAAVTLRGSGPGAGGDLLTVTETIEAPFPANISLSNISNGGVASNYQRTLDVRVGDFDGHDHIGLDWGRQSWSFQDGGPDGIYVSRSSTGNDIWDCGDDFEYAHSVVTGDFDLSIRISDLTGGGRWGRYGLMARQSLDRDARFTMVHNCNADPGTDPARVLKRVVHRQGCGGIYEFLRPDGLTNQFTYLRLTRRGSRIQGWYSNDNAVRTQPANDALWIAGHEDDWGPDAPPNIHVGFANSMHSSGGPTGLQSIFFFVNHMDFAGTSPINITGKKITWTNVPRSAVTTGLRYNLQYTKKGATVHGGENFFSTFTGGIQRIEFDPATPFGQFDGSLSIGGPPTPGSATFTPSAAGGSYTMVSSGTDIWDDGDQFRYCYKKFTGDFFIEARIADRTNPPADSRWGKHGLMARWSCNTDAKYSMVFTSLASPGQPLDNGGHHLRVFDGRLSGSRFPYAVDTGVLGSLLPPWMRLERRGKAIYTFMAEDVAGLPGTGAHTVWMLVGSDSDPNMPADMLGGMALTAHTGATGSQGSIRFERFRHGRLDDGVDLEPIGYELAATSTAGLGSNPYLPIQIEAQLASSPEEAVEQGGSGLGVKNRGWYWTDLQVGGEDLRGARQLLWNLENRNLAGARLRWRFQELSRVYIAWDRRHVKGGADNPAGTFNNGWFDFNNNTGTLNAQGWRRLSGSSAIDPNADVIRVNSAASGGDDNFAQGGVWFKDFKSGEMLETLATGFATLRSPYVVFVRPGSLSGRLGEILRFNFQQANGPPQNATAVQHGGDLSARVEAGRLRLVTEDDTQSANAVWYNLRSLDARLGGLADKGFAVQFEAFFRRNGVPGNPDADPADGMTLAIIQTGGTGNPLGTFPSNLDLATLHGDPGASLGYQGGTLRERTEGHPSFAVELDCWMEGGEPGNEPAGGGAPDFDGRWHIGLDVNSDISSLQTNVDLGVAVPTLPDLFAASGVTVEVEYSPPGMVRAWVRGNGGAGTRRMVLDYRIAPLHGDVILGFTAATGDRTATIEVDNVVIFPLCSEIPDTVSIAGPAQAAQGEKVTLTALPGGVDAGAAGNYSWQKVSGSATLVDRGGGLADVTRTGPGEIRIRVNMTDGGCSDAATATHSIQSSTAGPFRRGDCDGSGVFDMTDGIFLLNANFRGQPDPPCYAACDANADGFVAGEVTDAIYMFQALFLGGPAPPAPFQTCAGSALPSDAAAGCRAPTCSP